jgi:hypothetical protein
MFITRSRNRVFTFTAAGALALGALSLTGCDANGPEQGTDVEDLDEDQGVEETEATDDMEDDDDDGGDGQSAYEGPYDAAFMNEIDSYVGQTVTVSGQVGESFTDLAFTVVGPAGEADPLLVLGGDAEADLEDGIEVQVTGVVEEAFNIGAAEDEWNIDLDDEVFGDWEGLRYLDAEEVQVVAEQ